MLSLSPSVLGWQRRSAQLLASALLATSAGMVQAHDEAPAITTPATADATVTANTTALEDATTNATPAPTLGLQVPQTGGLTVPVQVHILNSPRPTKDDNGNDGEDDDDEDTPQANSRKLPKIDLQFPQEYGLASWYGIKHHQKRTASGERFDMRDFTAAHPTLPFGSRVCVRSNITGREVIVRINDRGPHGGKRVIDISHAAADALGIVNIGTKPVTIHALPDEDSDCPRT